MRVVAVDGCLGDAHGLAGVDYPLATRADLETLASDTVSTLVADVRDPHAMMGAAQHAVDTFGRLDVGVAAAAVIAGGRPLWETPPADLDTLWQTDVLGVWHTATAVVPHLLSGPDPSRCRFVAVASAAASEGLFHLAAYTTVKHAVLGLVRGLAADLTGTGVIAVAVSPDATRTRDARCDGGAVRARLVGPAGREPPRRPPVRAGGGRGDRGPGLRGRRAGPERCRGQGRAAPAP